MLAGAGAAEAPFASARSARKCCARFRPDRPGRCVRLNAFVSCVQKPVSLAMRAFCFFVHGCGAGLPAGLGGFAAQSRSFGRPRWWEPGGRGSLPRLKRPWSIESPAIGRLCAPTPDAPRETSPPSRLHCRGLLRLKTEVRSRRRSGHSVHGIARAGSGDSVACRLPCGAQHSR